MGAAEPEPNFNSASYFASDFVIPPADALATLSLQPDGDIFRTLNGGANSNVGTWFTGGITPGDWEVRYTNSGGSNPNWGPGDAISPTWVNLGSAVTWGAEETGIGNIACTGTIEIRPAGGGSIVDSCTFQLNAEATP